MKEFSDGLPASELKHLWLNVFNYFRNLGQVQTPYFTWAKSNANEKNTLFYLISIRFGSFDTASELGLKDVRAQNFPCTEFFLNFYCREKMIRLY